jgi:hypothetical protein
LKLIHLLIALPLILSTACSSASQEDDHVHSVSPTKFGLLEFMRPSHNVRLNGHTLLTSGQNVDPYGYRLVLLEAESFVAPNGEAKVTEDGRQVEKRFVDRVVVAEAVDGTCARQFMIVDLRGIKPFVSERFGLNPKGTSCLKFKRAKWDAKESYIQLDGPLKYIYYTGGKVIGPIE